MVRKKILKRIRPVTALAAAAILLCAVFVCADDEGTFTAVSDDRHINQFGNVELLRDGKNVLPGDLEEAGIEYGDVVTVSFLDKALEMPVVSDYGEVGNGTDVICIKDDKVVAAKNMGDFASEYIADKSTFEDGSFDWTYKKGIKGTLDFTITMKTKGGLYAAYGRNKLSYTDDREDYPDLTDEEFANFRPVITSGMGMNVLYRTSSPVNPEHKRNTYADAAMKRAGVKAVINMADDENRMRSYEGYGDSYYSTIDQLPLNMGVSILSDDFRGKLAEGMRFIVTHEGPYAIHCTEGKDRAGIAAALLECFMGATYDEVVRDYMLSYYNYYGITEYDDQYDTIVRENVDQTLMAAFGTDDLRHADLKAEAEDYFRELGLSDAELSALRTKLGETYTSPAMIWLTVAGGIAVIIAAFWLAVKGVIR